MSDAQSSIQANNAMAGTGAATINLADLVDFEHLSSFTKAKLDFAQLEINDLLQRQRDSIGVLREELYRLRSRGPLPVGVRSQPAESVPKEAVGGEPNVSEKASCSISAHIDLSKEMESLRDEVNSEKAKRREAQSEMIQLRGGIRVIVRVKPFDVAKQHCGVAYTITPGSITIPGSGSIFKRQGRRNLRDCTYNADRVFWTADANERLSEEITALAKSAIHGPQNAPLLIAAYGRTNTGKTYNMDRLTREVINLVFAEKDAMLAEKVGAVEVSVKAQFLEAYVGHAYLLPSTKGEKYKQIHYGTEAPFRPRLEPSAPVAVDMQAVGSAAAAMVMWEIGMTGRHTRDMKEIGGQNGSSSRGHTVLRICIFIKHSAQHDGAEQPEIRREIILADLAGSEKRPKGSVAGAESGAISTSLRELLALLTDIRKASRRAVLEDNSPYRPPGLKVARQSLLLRMLWPVLGHEIAPMVVVLGTIGHGQPEAPSSVKPRAHEVQDEPDAHEGDRITLKSLQEIIGATTPVR